MKIIFLRAVAECGDGVAKLLLRPPVLGPLILIFENLEVGTLQTPPNQSPGQDIDGRIRYPPDLLIRPKTYFLPF